MVNHDANDIEDDGSAVDHREFEHRWWTGAVLLVGALLLARSFFDVLVSWLPGELPTWLKNAIQNASVIVVVSPLLGWIFLRGRKASATTDVRTKAHSPHHRVRGAMIVSVGLMSCLVGWSQWADITANAIFKDETEAIYEAKQQSLHCERLSWLVTVDDRRRMDVASIAEVRRDMSLAHDAIRQRLFRIKNQHAEGVEEVYRAWNVTRPNYESLAMAIDELMNLLNATEQAETLDVQAHLSAIKERSREYGAAMSEVAQLLQSNCNSGQLKTRQAKIASVAMLTLMLLVIVSLVIEPTIHLVRTQHLELASQNATLQRLATVAQHTNNAVIITDAARGIAWVNDAFTRITGYTLDDVRGQKLDHFHQTEHADPATLDELTAAFESERSYRCEILHRGKEGREFWLDVNVHCERNSQGALTGFVAVETDITMLVLERERLRSTFAAVAEGIVQMNVDGQVIACNPAAERLLGLSFDQMRGMTPDDEYWGATRENGGPLPADEHPACVTLKTGQSIRNFVHGIHTPHGEHRLISVSTEPVRDADGEIRAVVASFADITEQREQSKRMQMVIDGAELGTWDWDLRTGYVVFNQHWAGMLGYSLKEIAPHVSTWENLVHPEDMPEVSRALTAHLEGGTAEFRKEVRMLRKDGTWSWVLTAGKVTARDEEGSAIRVMGMHVDISTQKQAEEELHEAKSNAETALREVNALRSALDEHSLLSVADASGRIIDVNTGFLRISGYSREELIGQDHRMLNSGIHGKKFWINVWSTIASGKTWRGEVCNRRKDGALYWVDSTIVPYRSAEGRIEKYVSIRFDITAQKAAEEALVAAQAQAEAANAAKTEFLANMSHEIRTPMTAILGFTDLLAVEGHRDSQPIRRLEYIDTIRRNGEHLLEIINDILDISKIEAGKMSIESVPTSPANLVHDVLSLMDVRAKAKGLRLEAIFENAVPEFIQTDPVRVRQILVNLVGNALKFTEIGQVLLSIRTDFVNRRMSFTVSDSGIGMSQAQIDRLFGAFVQADASTTRKFGGTGLGLRISKRLAEMLGGDIDVESAPGRGSCFTATIMTGDLEGVTTLEPLSARAAVRDVLTVPARTTDASKPSESEMALAGMRILLAEDGPDNQRLIGHFLRKAGAEVVVVENGKLAVESLTVDNTLEGALIVPPPFDLCVTDMQMPEMDGYAATRLLRAKGSTLPIVALTANAMSSDMQRCLDAGCDDYATKPIDKQSLVQTCARWAKLGKARNRGVEVGDDQSVLQADTVLNLFHGLMSHSRNQVFRDSDAVPS